MTDPVTLTSAIDLPNESVKGMAVVREPVSATFSGVLGSMASIETTAGTGAFHAGVQGFIPRPRLNSQYGLGRIEAFFPRAYVSGRVGARARYFSSIELNFERVPVPGVTTQSGTPAVGASGVVSFGRIDFDLSPSNTLTLEGLFLPATSSFTGLSPLQQPESSPDVYARDLFGGVVDRIVLGPSRSADAARRPDEPRHEDHAGRRRRRGAAARRLAAELVLRRRHVRRAVVDLDRLGPIRHRARGTHNLSVSGDIQFRSMSSDIVHQSIRIEDDLGRLTRSIDFAPLARPIETDDARGGGGFRDLWDVNPRLQLDLDLRLDVYARFRRHAVAAHRRALRLDADARTTLKASAGRFVGRPPLGAQAFGQFPARLDRTFNPRDRRVDCVAHLRAGHRARSSCREPTASPWKSSGRSGRASKCRRPSAPATARTSRP